MPFESRKTKSAREAALRRAMSTILEGLPAPVEITLSKDSRRLRALLRSAPYLCIELEARSGDLPMLARIFTPSSEETLPLSKGEEEADRLRKRLRQYLSIESDAPTPAAAGRSYRLKVSVLSDFSYLPHWEELGHTDVRIGGGMTVGGKKDGSETPPEDAY